MESLYGSDSSTASVAIELVPLAERKRSADDVAEE